MQKREGRPTCNCIYLQFGVFVYNYNRWGEYNGIYLSKMHDIEIYLCYNVFM